MKRKNGLGIAGLIIALIGMILSLLSLIPLFGVILGVISWPFCALGFLLSFIALFLRNKKKGAAIFGILFALIGLAIYWVPILFLAAA